MTRGLEVLGEVRRANEAAREDDQRRRDDLADSNPRAPIPTREGIDIDVWRALPKSPTAS